VKFLDVISGWINRYFSHEEAIYLVVLLAAALLVLVTLGGVLAPVLTGLVLAFLLQGLVARLCRLGVPERLAVHVTFLLFISGLIALILFVLPLVWRQLSALVAALPDLVVALQGSVRKLPEVLPTVVSNAQVEVWLSTLADEVSGVGRVVVEGVLSQLPGIVGLTIYLVLVPISVFFMLKDRGQLLAWLRSLLPAQRPLLDRVGTEMSAQIANYVRGKFAEILITGVVTYVTFTLLGLNYAALLSMTVGISVLVPYIGAAAVTVPVALVGYVQWGWSWEFGYVMAAYAVIQALDGNVLVPLLFSEAVDLHPLTIIVAVLVFGGLWGFWGVFFAIPLATLVKAIYQAWPRQTDEQIEQGSGGDSAAAL
jgi:putative permease